MCLRNHRLLFIFFMLLYADGNRQTFKYLDKSAATISTSRSPAAGLKCSGARETSYDAGIKSDHRGKFIYSNFLNYCTTNISSSLIRFECYYYNK